MRELRNVRELPQEGATTPLTAEEELRVRAVFVADIGARLVRQGWATFPAYTPEERIRLFAVARMIEERLGCRVEAVPEDICSMRFTVTGTDDPATDTAVSGAADSATALPGAGGSAAAVSGSGAGDSGRLAD
ncbi:hypothetical protein [Streptomyces sp. 2A115]|uniref:hypothetical protein n=1 Tax=Streptomyces sp. 2A115 TaxID=3457439 RepID=UPI003FD32A12